MSQASTLPSPNALGAPNFPEGHWTQRVYYGLSGRIWARIAIVGVLFIAVFWPNLRRLFIKTAPVIGEPNWGHSFFVPLIGLYYLYLNREALLSTPALRAHKNKAWRARGFAAWFMIQAVVMGVVAGVWGYRSSLFGGSTLLGIAGAVAAVAVVTSPLFWWEGARKLAGQLASSSATWFGIFLMVWGIWFFSWSIWPGQNDFFKDVAMVISLFGVVLALCGWHVMRIAWFPLAFLFCALPWPPLIYSQVALPLQELAATAAVFTLKALGMDAMRFGTKMFINGKAYEVAEACAGLKSLMTFISIAAAVAFLSARPLWQKLIISASAVPIAIFCNVVRVTGIGLLSSWDPRWAESFAHMFVGLVLLIPAFFMIMLVGWILDNLFIEEADRKAPAKPMVIEVPRSAAARPAVATAHVGSAATRAAAPSPAPARASQTVQDPLAPTNQDLADATRRMMANQSRRIAPRPAAQPTSPQAPKAPKQEGK